MKTYTLKKGKHDSIFPLPKFHTGVYVYNVSFVFNSNCWYNTNIKDGTDLNKLCGFTYWRIHKNSIRLAWRPSKTKGFIEIHSYVYHNGVRATKHICDIHTDKLYKASISINSLYGIINITADLIHYNQIIELKYKNRWGAFCFPYFGGDNKAPHEMKIDMKYCYR